MKSLICRTRAKKLCLNYGYKGVEAGRFLIAIVSLFSGCCKGWRSPSLNIICAISNLTMSLSINSSRLPCRVNRNQPMAGAFVSS